MNSVDMVAARLRVLESLGASRAERDELLLHNELVFKDSFPAGTVSVPLADEPFVSEWRGYAERVKSAGSIGVLSEFLVQFSFPIERGISQSEIYQNAVRRGISDGLFRLQLEAPRAARLFIHQTPAGGIPVLVAGCRTDFELLTQALTLKNEPMLVAQAQGACMIAGYVNWSRATTASAEKGVPVNALPKTDYQDRFILLSEGDYSGVSATDMGLAPATWRSLSAIIRLEHECAHYVTKRLFGAMRNDALNELIADYAGITAAAGCFRSDWFLRFLGLERFPACRPGGRLYRYRGSPALSDGAFTIQQRLVYRAAHNVERVRIDRSDTLLMTCALAQQPLELLAEDQAPRVLEELLASARRRWLTPRHNLLDSQSNDTKEQLTNA